MKPKSVHDLDTVLYSLYVFITPISDRDLKHLIRRMRYHCEKDNVSGMVAVSSTASETAKQSVIKTNGRGRPRKIVIGDKVDRHTHVCLKGTDSNSARRTAFKVKADIDKRVGKAVCEVVPKGKCTAPHAKNFVQYSINQSDEIRTFGTFDFKKFAKE